MQKNYIGKTYNFKPWTLAYAGTDPTARPRTPVHAMPSQVLLSIYTFLCYTYPPPPGGYDPPEGVRTAVDTRQCSGHEDTTYTALCHRGVFSHPPTTLLVSVGPCAVNAGSTGLLSVQ